MSCTVGEVINCRAAVLWEQKQPLVIETIQVTPPRSGEIRVKMVATGLCRSDLHVIEAMPTAFKLKFPTILGHEGAGIVESVGDGVTSVSPGDHVVPLWMPQCDSC